jgi:predicted metal-dependent hydrolase
VSERPEIGVCAVARFPTVAAEAMVVRRSARARHARLTIGPDGEAIVILPSRAPAAWADELVAERSAWVARHRQRIVERNARLAARPALGAGRPVPFAGVPHALEVLAVAARRSRIEHDDSDAPTLRLLLARGDERPLAAIVESWLRPEARAAIGRRVAVRAPQLGVGEPRISIRDQRSRWGSASRRGRVSFSWRLVLAPAVVLDYVVVHELAHLRDFSHSARFWSLVRGVSADVDAARRWLRDNEFDVRHALD